MRIVRKCYGGEAGATLALRENKGPTTGVPLSGDEYPPREK
jgi:hypothetical protein